jgi:hypothetical protein
MRRRSAAMPLKLLQTEAEFYGNALRYFSGPTPVFMARIGGSDTDAVVDYYQAKLGGVEQPPASRARYLDLVKRYNGFYDLTDSADSFERYCETLLACYHGATQMVFCNYQLLSLYFRKWIHPQFARDDFENKAGCELLVKSMNAAPQIMECYPYPFIERVVFDGWTLFRAFSAVLPGKKVLVVSPFAESITGNFHNRRSFFRDYTYPEFDLVTYNTPITYSGLPPELYPDSSWHETLARMQREVAALDFDIALLSCGSYALPLGEFIARKCGKHAVYVGGVLQLYFGVMGRRYVNPFFLDQINREAFITPVEGEKYLKYGTIDATTATEALGAYF